MELSPDPSSLVLSYGAGSVVRAPGGLVAAAIGLGADVRLCGPTPQWFVGLGSAVTGRAWTLINPAQANQLMRRSAAVVKLADAKSRDFPARLFHSPDELQAAVAAVGGSDQLQLLATTEWLPIESEYRVFTMGRAALTVSPYQVEDEPWTPLLHTHRASFHGQAAEYVSGLLDELPDGEVPPAAALDVAWLRSGRMVLLEANQAWAAGLYGCDPDAALQAVLAANRSADDHHDRWSWRPDSDLAVPG